MLHIDCIENIHFKRATSKSFSYNFPYQRDAVDDITQIYFIVLYSELRAYK